MNTSLKTSNVITW